MTPIPRNLRPTALLATLAAAALLAGCTATPTAAPPAAPSAASKSDTVTVRLIGFNDLHGNLEPANLSLPWPDPANPQRALRLAAGGAAYMAGTIQALRAGAPHSFVLSAGDHIGATPLVSALFLHESTIDIMNRMGVDLATLGNHEFDAGKAELQRMMAGGCTTLAADSPMQSCVLGRFEGARFPHFSANVVDAAGQPLVPPSVVKTVDGVKVGFIGAATKITPSIVVPSGVAGLRFLDEADAINAEAERLVRQGVRALVAVIHEGGSTGTPGPLEWNDAGCPEPRGAIFDIVKRLHPEIDAVFTGHTHQGYRCVIDGRPVMQATAQGRGLSVADLVIDRKSGDVDRARTTHRNVPVFNSGSDATLREAILKAEPEPFASALRQARPDAAIAARVAEYSAAAAPRAQRPVGRITATFSRTAETDSAAGRLIADAQWAATRAPDRGGAQLALMNPGGVRSDLPCRGTPPCTVTYGDAFTMQPFGNSLVVMTLTGAQFKDLLENQQRQGRTSPTFLIPSSSLRYTWVASAPFGQRVRDVTIDGRPLDPKAEIRFTVNSFMAEGGDGFTALRDGRDRLGGELDIDALIAYLQTERSPDPVARVKVVP
jgi:5'-nucleotidase